MRWLSAALLLLALSGAQPARADDVDVDWYMQDHPRFVLELRGVAELTGPGSTLDPAGGGELALGGWLGDFLAMELRAGLSFIRTDQDVRASYYGMSLRWRIFEAAVSPTLGGAVLWHDRNAPLDDGLALRGELGLGAWLGDHFALVVGVTGSFFAYGIVGERAVGAYLGFDLLL